MSFASHASAISQFAFLRLFFSHWPTKIVIEPCARSIPFLLLFSMLFFPLSSISFIKTLCAVTFESTYISICCCCGVFFFTFHLILISIRNYTILAFEMNVISDASSPHYHSFLILFDFFPFLSNKINQIEPLNGKDNQRIYTNRYVIWCAHLSWKYF